MSRSHRLPVSRPSLAVLILIAAAPLAACTFGPREPESVPLNTGDGIAEASAHEGETKVDKDGFRTPDAQRVMEDAPSADSDSDAADGGKADGQSAGSESTDEEASAAVKSAAEQPEAVRPESSPEEDDSLNTDPPFESTWVHTKGQGRTPPRRDSAFFGFHL